MVRRMARKRQYWLMKSEPDVYSIDDLARDETTPWEGVRNYQARNSMREMKEGDLVLFYHSNAKPPGVAGLAEVCREAYADPTQFDKKSKYYDAKSKPEDPRWDRVDVRFVEKLELVSLDALKAEADGKLEGMLVVRKGNRLSVTPVDRPHFLAVLKMAGASTKGR